MKGYISAREASYRWGVSERRVHQYCQAGRIPGVTRFGRSWVIPDDAEKPTDPRNEKEHRKLPAVCDGSGSDEEVCKEKYQNE